MEVLVLDTEFRAVSVIDNFESLIWTDRYYEAGDFEIYTAATVEMLQILKLDYYLWCKESEHVMIIEAIEIKTDPEEGNKLIVTGRSLESILDRRIIFGQTNVDDNLQNGVKKILMNNVINPLDETRKIENFIFEESTDIEILSLFLITQYNGENLYEALVDICKSMGVGFKITLNDENQFVFKLYYGTDRTYNQIEYPSVVFSNHFDNLINSDYISSKRDFKTVTIVGGEGEGDDRVMVGVSIDSGTGSGLERRESFTDCHATSTNSGGGITAEEYMYQLFQKGLEDLSSHIITESFEGEITDTLFTYDKDYYIGDIVEVSDDYGNNSEPRIIEYIYSYSNDEMKFYPTFGYDEYSADRYRNENCFLVQVYELDIDETYPTNSWCDENEPVLERYYSYDQITVDTLSDLWKEPVTNYTCRLTQYVYVTDDISITTGIKIGNKGNLYLNNVLLSTVNETTSSVILNLYTGWNKIDIVFTQSDGYLTDNLYLESNVTHAVPKYLNIRI